MKSFADLYDDNETIKKRGTQRYSSFADLYDFSSPQVEPENNDGFFST